MELAVLYASWIYIDSIIVVMIDFIGLISLFIVGIVSCLLNNKCMMIDCVRGCSSWSSFQLFYNFNPKSLIKYYQIDVAGLGLVIETDL